MADLLVVACLVVAAGCQQAPKTCDCGRCRGAAVVMACPGAPVISVVPDGSSCLQTHDLFDLTTDVRSALLALGGLKLAGCTAECQTSPCQPLPTVMSSDSGEIQQASLTRSDPLPPDFAFPVSEAGLEVRIAIDEFRPYRPITLQATITIVNVTTGEVVTTLQGAWSGERAEPIADADHGLLASLKHPQERPVIESQTLHGISPRTFLRNVAYEMAPAIHQACLNAPVTTFQ
ncbi:MAG: hypothetical protein R3C49_09770 [Planctomycetaceae bacterium]